MVETLVEAEEENDEEAAIQKKNKFDRRLQVITGNPGGGGLYVVSHSAFVEFKCAPTVGTWSDRGRPLKDLPINAHPRLSPPRNDNFGR